MRNISKPEIINRFLTRVVYKIYKSCVIIGKISFQYENIELTDYFPYKMWFEKKIV